MKVSISTPQAGPLALALSTAVVWVPHLATETLFDIITSVITLLIESLHASMKLVAQIDSIPKDSSLGFLIFKTNYNLANFGPCFFVQKSSDTGHFEAISIL